MIIVFDIKRYKVKDKERKADKFDEMLLKRLRLVELHDY